MITETDTSITASDISDTDLSSDRASDQESQRNLPKVLLEQYAQDVIDFSSQFGSDFSISYTVFNLLAKPTKFPAYGDFPETFAFRKYGAWDADLKSYSGEFMPQNLPAIPAQDFVITKFEEFTFPHAIRIYETFQPGALVRIFAFYEKWHLLWEASQLEERLEPRARIFSPPIKRLMLPTKIIRLEFNHSKLDYYTEIDAIVLVGTKCVISSPCYLSSSRKSGSKRRQMGKGPISKRLEMVKFQPQMNANQSRVIEDFFKHDLDRFLETAGLKEETEAAKISTSPTPSAARASLNNLPYEVLFRIFSLLDLRSLFLVAQVSRTLHEVATDPLLYTEVNLKPYWHVANSELIAALTKRGSLLRKLDLSWCGLFNSITASDFKELIKNNGQNMTHLRLNSCKFLNASCLEMIGTTCDNLKDLSLRNYSATNPSEFIILSRLTQLERLDLFRAGIETYPLLNILKNNPNLKHLNLAFSSLSVNMDEVAVQISKYNKQLISLDLWKSYSLTSVGLAALAELPCLEEVDFGWCLREEAAPSESLKKLLIGCPKLRKLFLAAIRGLSDRDLDSIAMYCPNLEQLDLMGIIGISTEMVYRILTNCRKLRLLDLSFCDQLDEIQIHLWREIFPCDIKRSSAPVDVPF